MTASVLYQGTTSVVPTRSSQTLRALAPAIQETFDAKATSVFIFEYEVKNVMSDSESQYVELSVADVQHHRKHILFILRRPRPAIMVFQEAFGVILTFVPCSSIRQSRIRRHRSGALPPQIVAGLRGQVR